MPTCKTARDSEVLINGMVAGGKLPADMIIVVGGVPAAELTTDDWVSTREMTAAGNEVSISETTVGY